MNELKIIGRREFISFPELDIPSVEAKIDTGAYTSSIHCDTIERNGNMVSFTVLDPSHPEYSGKVITSEIIKEVKVKSSNGMEEERFMIQSSVSIFDRVYTIQLTLTDRSNMNYPILLGRKFLAGKFLVDVRLKHQNEL